MIIPFEPEATLEKIVVHLQAGELVALPTETVYGLAGDASNPKAIKKIFDLKGRPKEQALSVLIEDKADMEIWATEIPPYAVKLAEHFWPGPLTLILPKASYVNPLLTGHLSSIGLRVPAHPIALAVLKKFGRGLAAPSANSWGQAPPITAQEVAHYFLSDLWIIEGGHAKFGFASTIVDCTGTQPIILRQGALPEKKIFEVL
jgi:L-threonylcarbamoyladenylate synthase